MSFLSKTFKKSKASLGRQACDAAFDGDFDKAFALVAKGADINTSRFVQRDPGNTSGEGNIGHAALRHDNIEALKKALDLGLDVNFHSNFRGPLLEVAIQNGQTEAAKLLIERGAEIQTAPEGRFNALTLAKIHQEAEIVALIEAKLYPERAQPEPSPPPIDTRPVTGKAVKPLKTVQFRKG